MRISTLIKKLQLAKKQHGNLMVAVDGAFVDPENILNDYRMDGISKTFKVEDVVWGDSCGSTKTLILNPYPYLEDNNENK